MKKFDSFIFILRAKQVVGAPEESCGGLLRGLGAREPMIQFDPLDEIDDARRGDAYVVPLRGLLAGAGAQGAPEVLVGEQFDGVFRHGLDIEVGREKARVLLDEFTDAARLREPENGKAERSGLEHDEWIRVLARGEGKKVEARKKIARIFAMAGEMDAILQSKAAHIVPEHAEFRTGGITAHPHEMNRAAVQAVFDRAGQLNEQIGRLAPIRRARSTDDQGVRGNIEFFACTAARRGGGCFRSCEREFMDDEYFLRLKAESLGEAIGHGAGRGDEAIGVLHDLGVVQRAGTVGDPVTQFVNVSDDGTGKRGEGVQQFAIGDGVGVNDVVMLPAEFLEEGAVVSLRPDGGSGDRLEILPHGTVTFEQDVRDDSGLGGDPPDQVEQENLGAVRLRVMRNEEHFGVHFVG